MTTKVIDYAKEPTRAERARITRAAKMAAEREEEEFLKSSPLKADNPEHGAADRPVAEWVTAFTNATKEKHQCHRSN
jgi:hypothetical protein